jgi:hypothetical protein
MDFTISGEGEFRKKDKTTEVGAIAISKYIFDEVQAGRQPTVWVRFDFTGEDAGTYIMGYFNTTSWSGDFGTDISTFSGEWKVDADTVVFEVAPPALAFTTNLPTTKSVAAGSALNMSVVVEVARALHLRLEERRHGCQRANNGDLQQGQRCFW